MTQAFQYTKAQLSKLSLKDLKAMIKLRLPDVTDAQLKLINSKNKASMIKKFVETIQADEQVVDKNVDDADDLNYAHIHPKKSQTYNSPFDDENFGVNPSAYENQFASVSSSYESPSFPDQYASSIVSHTPQKYSSSSLLPDQKVSSSVPSLLDQKESSLSLQLSPSLFPDQSASSSSGENSPQFIDDNASTSSHPFMTATVPTPPQPKKSKRIAATIENTKVVDKISIPRTSTRRPKKEADEPGFTKPLVVKPKKGGKTSVVL